MFLATLRASCRSLFLVLPSLWCFAPAGHAVEFDERRDGDRREVAIVDPSVAGYRELVAGFAPGTPVLLLDPAGALEAQLAAWLVGIGPVDTIHLVSHGSPGVLQFGEREIRLRDVQEHARSWQSIGRSLRPGGDLLLYGCRVGADLAGRRLVESLAELTGADVAASDTLTGAAAKGGDWVFEVVTGSIESTAFDGQASGFRSVLGPAPGTIVFSNRGSLLPSGNHLNPSIIDLGGLGLDLFVETMYGVSTGIHETTTGGSNSAISEPGDASLQIFGLGGARIVQIRFVSTDGAHFQINSLMAGVSVAATLNFTGWRDGRQVASTSADMSTGLDANGNKTISFDADWDSIDEIRVSPDPQVWPMVVAFDDLVIATAADVAPYDLTLGAASINQSAASPGAAIGTLTTIDDPTDTYTYTLVPGEGDTHNNLFVVDGATLEIGDAALGIGDYSVRLRTTDGGGMFFEKAFAITVVGPRITAVHAMTSAATYDVGASFLIRVTFSKAVNVTGTPTLTLETGDTDRAIPYESGSGSTQLTFRYTVQEGDLSSDLDYASADALALDGGTIRDADENDALLTLPAPGASGSLAANESIVIGDGLPTAISHSLASFHPSLAVSGTTIATLSTTNPDASDTHTYALVAGEGDTHNGLFAIDGDTLVLASASLAFGDYTIRVRTTDTSGNFLEQAIAFTVAATIPQGSWFDRDSPRHEFPTTTGKLSMGVWKHPIGERGPGVYTLELEITGTGYWPGQEGYNFGVIGLPASSTTFHELGQFTHEWAFRGRQGRRFGEGSVTLFGSVFKDLGDRIRLEMNTLTGELRVYTKRGAGGYVLEGGQALFTGLAAPNKVLHFAVSGIAWQPASVLVISETFPNSAPTDATLSDNSIAQSAAIAGATIGTLSATDSDVDDTHTYAFATGEGDTDNASFALDGATLKIGASALAAGAYSVRIRTTDEEDGIFDKTFSITVVDDVAPRIQSIARHAPDASPTAADSLVWRIAFSEAVVGVDAGDFAVTGTTATVSEVASAGGNAFDVTVSGGDLAELNGTVTLAFADAPTIADAASNALVDTTPTGANETTYALVNNAPPSALALSATSINETAAIAGATIGTLTTTDADAGDTHEYDLVAGEGDTHNASFALDGATLSLGDAALPPGSYSVRIRTADSRGGEFVREFTIEVIDNIQPAAPSLPDLATASDSGVSAADNLTNVRTPLFTGTAEAGATVTLHADGTEIGSGLADGSGAWSITTTELADGTYAITATATDAAGNVGAASAALAVTIETAAPVIAVGAPSTTLARTGPVTWSIDYTDEHFAASSLTLADIMLNKTGTADGTLALTGSGASYTVTVSDLTGDGTLGLAIAAGTASDQAGNQAPALAASATVAVDNIAPFVAALRRQTPATLHTTEATLIWRVEFDADVTGVDVADFAVTPLAGEIGAEVESVEPVNASTYDIAVAIGSGLAQLRLNLNATGTGIADLAGNPIAGGGFTAGEFFLAGATSVFDSLALAPALSPLLVSDTSHHRLAQRFTTGAAAPLTLQTIGVSLAGVTAPIPVVEVYADEAGAIGAHVATLTNPEVVEANALNVWRSAQVLDAHTSYWLVFGAEEGSYEIDYTPATNGGSGAWLTSPTDYVYRSGDVMEVANVPSAGVLKIALGATSIPSITSTLTASGTYGSSFSYQITATSTPTSYAATNLPSGLNLDTTTGIISGSPTQTGTFSNISLTATNGSGTSSPATLVLTISPASASVALASLTRTYTGQPLAPTITTNPSGLPLIVTYNGSTTVPTAVGSYNVLASVSDPNYSGSSSGVFNITQAVATVTLGNLTHTYDGTAKSVTATTVPAGLEVTLSYDPANPTQPGSYTVTATVNAPNHTGTATGTLTIVPAVTPPPVIPSVGSSVELTATDGLGGTGQWQRNGTTLLTGTGSSLTLTDLQPPTAGLYTYTTPLPGGGTGTSEPVIVGLTTDEPVIGSGSQVGSDIVHPNGNVYDQVLLEGNGASVTASTNKVTRVSFLDLTNDIVQVEFSGAGTLSVVMDDASMPAPALNYNQENVDYVRGHVGLVITGANETSNLSIFSVGPITAVNQTLFKEDVVYDGVADIAFVAIQSANGKFGGIRTGNAHYYASQGFTGVYAPGVEIAGPINIGDVTAFDSATPVLVFGTAGTVNLTGGDLQQDNGSPVTVSGITQLKMAAGTTSQGVTLPAQQNQGVLSENGANVTGQIVVNP